jgi:galactose-1-phosphate uridylyltransferase
MEFCRLWSALGQHPHGSVLRLDAAPPRLPRPTTTTRDLVKRIRKKSPLKRMIRKKTSLERMIRKNSSMMTMTLAEMFSSRGMIS